MKDEPAQRMSRQQALWRCAEFGIVFFALPLIYAFRVIKVPMIPLLLIIAVPCLAALLCDPGFSRRRLWDTADFGRRLSRVLLTFAIAGTALALSVWVLDRDHFLELVREYPVLWAFIMFLYPVVSVYPQEIIYRAFLFNRYQALFPRPWQMVCASAVSFGFMHVAFGNPVAVALSVAGGLLFAWTYQRTQSLLVTAIEHALYGCLIFTVGLGKYFFGGIEEFAARMTR